MSSDSIPTKHGIAEDARSLAQLESAVVRVASEDLLRAVYQPIYSLTTGLIIGFEGLVRPSPESGFSLADEPLRRRRSDAPHGRARCRLRPRRAGRRG